MVPTMKKQSYKERLPAMNMPKLEEVRKKEDMKRPSSFRIKLTESGMNSSLKLAKWSYAGN